METNIKEKINYWLSDIFDQNTKNKILELKKNNEKELYECFYKDLEFGTGGLRGIMGVGTNRMNKYTVGRATQGLANYLKEKFSNNNISAVIAYDSRNNSKFFAEITASVFSANNIKVFLFDDLRPTPELSFAVRHLKTNCGIVITASHNPKEYNGYKVYWSDGGQIVSPHDFAIIEKVNAINDFSLIKFDDKLANVTYLRNEIDEIYLSKIIEFNNTISDNKEKNLKIVFSPIHGSTGKLIPLLLSKAGYNSLEIVKEQLLPDGNFPSVESPNPEEKQALDLAIKLAIEKKADIVCCTDPDGDRLGVAVKDNDGNYVLLNGNQSASILTYYILSKLKKKEKLSENNFIVKTIVTTKLLTKISEHFNIQSFDVLTGFKYIAEVIEKNQDKMKFICGGEESYGFLADDFVRDKDAVLASLLLIEATQFAKNNSMTLIDYLNKIYLKFNLFKEGLKSITKYGSEGQQEIENMIINFRNNPPKEILNQKLIKISDFKNAITKDLINNTTTKIKLPISNVIQYELEDETIITIRPSGTEPKIKFYVTTSQKIENKEEIKEISLNLEKKIENIFNFLLNK